MDLVNDTPFAAERFLMLGGDGLERLVVVVKATFVAAPGAPRVADEQAPVATADAYRGEPATSSLVEAADAVTFKPATDVLVRGFAYTAPSDRTAVLAAFRVGPLQKGIRVVGDRRWERTLGFVRSSAPAPFARMELAWERAFGGADASRPDAPDACAENPVGVGFRARGSRLPVDGAPLPNLEDPAAPVRSPGDRPAPRAFGLVAPHWAPRSRHAGTYDDAWRKDRHPLLPEDFDARFFQVAPPDQVFPGYVRGGEPVVVAGMTQEGGLSFALPALAPHAAVRVGDEDERLGGACDTVAIDCEQRTVTVTWRAALVVQGRVGRVRWVRIGMGETHAA